MQLSDRGWPDLAVADYAGTLGEPGMKLYRQEVETRWRALASAAGRGRSGPSVPGRWAVVRLMEELAALDGVDALVEVLAADLSSPWQYVRIATALAAERRHADALAWAERRAEQHPLDAAAVFRRLAAARIEHRDRNGYAAAADLIARVGQLYERAAVPGEFAGYLDEVKAAHRPKRNFMAALAARGL